MALLLFVCEGLLVFVCRNGGCLWRWRLFVEVVVVCGGDGCLWRLVVVKKKVNGRLRFVKQTIHIQPTLSKSPKTPLAQRTLIRLSMPVKYPSSWFPSFHLSRWETFLRGGWRRKALVKSIIHTPDVPELSCINNRELPMSWWIGSGG